MKDFSNYWNALSFAFEKYGNLTRKSKKIPYVIHPIRITSILRAAGFNEFEHEELMLAALFHDLIEDTDLNLNELESKFGEKVALVVSELTKPEGANGREKNEWLENFINNSEEARIIKIADRIDNLLEMVSSWTLEKQISYIEQAKIILKSCGKSNTNLAKKLENLINSLLVKLLEK